MRQSTLLVVNTSVIYARMLLTVGIGLAITRLLVRALGEEEYGLLISLGAGGGLLTFMTGAMTDSAIRHLAYQDGNESRDQSRRVFGATLTVYAGMGVVIALAAVAIAPLILGSLTIPEGRETASWWVYAVSIGGILVTVGTTPFRALIQARQAMVFIALLELLGRVATLGLLVYLIFSPWDVLVGYPLVGMTVAALIGVVMVGVCWVRFPESRLPFSKAGREELGALTSFGGWLLLMQLALRFRSQLTLILLNSFFGGGVSAAYAISIQMQGYLAQLTGTIIKVVQPAMVSLHAKGQKAYVHKLVLVSSKYAAMMAVAAVIPIFLETEALLSLWLGQYPDWTPLFTRFLILTYALGPLTYGHLLAMQAHGEIKTLMLLQSIPAMSSVVVAAVIVWLTGCGPWLFPAMGVATTLVVIVFVRQAYVGAVIGLPTRVWFEQVVVKVFLVAAAGLVPAGAARFFLPEGNTRLIMVILCNFVAIVPVVWLVGLNHEEKSHARRILGAIRQRLTPKKHA